MSTAVEIHQRDEAGRTTTTSEDSHPHESAWYHKLDCEYLKSRLAMGTLWNHMKYTASLDKSFCLHRFWAQFFLMRLSRQTCLSHLLTLLRSWQHFWLVWTWEQCVDLAIYFWKLYLLNILYEKRIKDAFCSRGCVMSVSRGFGVWMHSRRWKKKKCSQHSQFSKSAYRHMWQAFHPLLKTAMSHADCKICWRISDLVGFSALLEPSRILLNKATQQIVLEENRLPILPTFPYLGLFSEARQHVQSHRSGGPPHEDSAQSLECDRKPSNSQAA